MTTRNRPVKSLPRRQSANRSRASSRTVTRDKTTKLGVLSKAFTNRDDSKPDIKGNIIERDRARNQTLSSSIVEVLNSSVSLANEQNELLAQIINELRGVTIPVGQPAPNVPGVDIDIDLDRDKRGKGQRGRPRAQAPKPAAPRPQASATRSVGSTLRSVGQAVTRIAPALGAAAAPATAAAAAAASLGVIGTAAYRAATMSPEEREAIRQRAEEQAAAGRQALTEGQQSGRGVGQGLRAGYYGDQSADLRLEDILDTLDTPAQNETPEQRAARERMASQLTRGNGRPTPEMIEYVRARRSVSTQQAPQENAPAPRAAEQVRSEFVTPSSFAAQDQQSTINGIQSLLSMLSDNEFNEIKIEAERLEFDGRIKLSGAEARLMGQAGIGRFEIESPGSDYQAPPVSSGGSARGGFATPVSRSAALTQQGASFGGVGPSITTGTGGGASSVGASPATPSISGGFTGTGGEEGAISQIIQTGPGFNLVQYDDGRIERRTGSRNWRNNNPGNLEFGNFARSYGAIGSDGRFAIFPTYEAGRRAKEALLFEGRGYAGLTVAQAITRYAPPNENDTAMYIRTAAAAAGVSPNTLMSDLNPDQRQALLGAMERVEGFRIGRVDVVQQATAVAAAQPPAVGEGAVVGAESAGMVAADQAQATGAGQQVIVQLPPRQDTVSRGSGSVQVSPRAMGEVSLNRRLERQVS